MAPLTSTLDPDAHNALLLQLDIHAHPKPFRNPSWKPPQRRNKNIRQIIADASRKEAASNSVLATHNNSGATTPMVVDSSDGGAATPANGTNGAGKGGGGVGDIAAASQHLSTLVLERNAAAAASSSGVGMGGPPAVTYTNIESAPSLHPSSQRRYCDVTGLPAPYTDPKTRLRYHNAEVFGMIRTMGQGATEGYLGARGAHTVL
ncbi:hypothetical protein K402DRAFT_396445, partial [Aulographum hederae CBS 113979]